jgi:hypothetical protein
MQNRTSHDIDGKWHRLQHRRVQSEQRAEAGHFNGTKFTVKSL